MLVRYRNRLAVTTSSAPELSSVCYSCGTRNYGFMALVCLICRAAEPDPKAVVEAFLTPEGLPDKKMMYTGEMLSFTQERRMG